MSGYYVGRLAYGSKAFYKVLHPSNTTFILTEETEATADKKIAAPRQGAPVFADRLPLLISRKAWSELEQQLQSWGATDPYAAMEWVLSIDEKYRAVAMNNVLLGWFLSDADRAFDWAQRFEKSVFRDGRLYAHLVESGRFDLAVSAVQLAGKDLDPVRMLFRAWARHDVSAALENLPRAGPPNSARWLVGATEVASHWAQTDPEAAALWCLDQISSAEVEFALRSVARSAAAASVSTLDQIAAQLPPGRARDGLLIGLITRPGRSDGGQKLDWARQLSDRPAAAEDGVLVFALAKISPIEAIHLLEEERNLSARDFRISAQVLRWAKSNPAAALQYANSSRALSNNARAGLIEKLRAVKTR